MTSTTNDAGAGGSLVRLVELLRRRKLLVFLPPLVLLALALVHSSLQSAAYRGQADVLLSRVNLQSMLNKQAVVGITADQFFQIQSTQASLAKSPIVAQRVLAAAHVTDMSARQLLAKTTVVPDRAKDFLHFQVEDPSPTQAQRLSETFAQQYVLYRQELDTAAIQGARAEIRQTLKALSPKDPNTRSDRESLTVTDQELMTLGALQSGNATYVQDDTQVAKVQPTPVRDAVLAVLLGLIVGVGLAFLREALDIRVRTPEEAGDILDLPFLGYLPPPPKARAGRSPLRMLENPESPAAESFRKLALNLEFTKLGPKAQTIMISSAVIGEGKSATIADLAVTLAQSSRRVALVDLDLRRPTLHALFGLKQDWGITDVALGHRSLSEVGEVIDLRPSESPRFRHDGSGELVLYPAGTPPPNPGAFLDGAEVMNLIEGLKDEFDYVLFDAPPLLEVGDPLTLSKRVDGVFLVVRIGSTNRAVLRELKRVIQNARASVLGFAVTGSGDWLKSYGLDGYAHGYGKPAHKAGAATALAERDRESVTSE